MTSGPRIAIFGPDPLLSISLHRRPDGSDEVHAHAAGQGVWVARMVAQLGGVPMLCGYAGGETGMLVSSLLARAGGEPRLVPTASPTGCYVTDRRGPEERVLAHAPATAPSRHEIDALLSKTCALATGADALVVCNPYPAEGFPADAYTELVADVAAAGVPVYADLSTPRLDAALAGHPDLVKLNDWELAQFVTGPVEGPLLAAAAQRLRALGARTVVVTRGERSAFAFTADRVLEITPPLLPRGHREGCGDAMMGALAVALARGDTLEAALALGAAAGAANFLRRGLASATRDVVEELVARVAVRGVDDLQAAG
jgi:1-phosphofructokinase